MIVRWIACNAMQYSAEQAGPGKGSARNRLTTAWGTTKRNEELEQKVQISKVFGSSERARTQQQ